eukprot:UN32842
MDSQDLKQLLDEIPVVDTPKDDTIKSEPTKPSNEDKPTDSDQVVKPINVPSPPNDNIPDHNNRELDNVIKLHETKRKVFNLKNENNYQKYQSNIDDISEDEGASMSMTEISEDFMADEEEESSMLYSGPVEKYPRYRERGMSFFCRIKSI